MYSWFKALVNRVPRPAWQLGLLWGENELQWNPKDSTAIVVVYSQKVCDGEIASYNDDIIRGGSFAVYRRIWISPAKVASFGKFEGW